MPELPEAEKAASIIKEIALDRIIQKVDTTEDKIVYSGTTDEQFASAIVGRKVTGVGRYGKVFYITLDSKGPHPVLHLGMTGMIHVKGQEPAYYRTKPKDNAQIWPPRFMKFILHIAATTTSPAAEIAFVDARRLGRIRLCVSPLTEPPISNLGFDPLLSMPSLKDFSVSVRKRSCTTKALLLDQSFSAGVGNWIADEVLYQARIHPEQRAQSLSDAQLALLHDKIVDVCRRAVEVNGDSSRFPEEWLFKHRWGKGKKGKNTILLPSGVSTVIKWIKVGGRTSAYVPEVQKLTKQDAPDLLQAEISSETGSNQLTPSEEESVTPSTPSKRKAPGFTNDGAPRTGSRSSKRIRMFTLEGTDVVEELSDRETLSPRRIARKAGRSLK